MVKDVKELVGRKVVISTQDAQVVGVLEFFNYNTSTIHLRKAVIVKDGSNIEIGFMILNSNYWRDLSAFKTM